jgi:Ser/Thr protein kinase RdoA (MazF antagonist)
LEGGFRALSPSIRISAAILTIAAIPSAVKEGRQGMARGWVLVYNGPKQVPAGTGRLKEGQLIMKHERIIAQFDIAGTLLSCEPFGAGLINETWRCSFRQAAGVRRYLLQRINRRVFTRPELVMENVETVTVHLAERLRKEGVADPASVSPVLIRTKDGRSSHVDEAGGHWRMFIFIEAGEVFDTVQSTGHAYEVGRGLGRFLALLSDLTPSRLHDTLPGFHHTPVYLRELDDSVREDRQVRVSAVRQELAFVDRRRHLAPLLLDALEAGKVPLRVVHNDPKVNNVLIDRMTGKALCLVDLDTVKPGTVLFDFGDCVRSAANPAGEDEPDLSRVVFDRVSYDAITRGYLDAAAAFLTKEELDLLPLSARVITFELGVRFLADHLRGDSYFKVRSPGHNLHRARVQFRLLESMEKAGL